jgi:hypothetical protein
LDDRIFVTGSDEAIDEGLSQGLYEETLGPQPHRKRMVGTELSHCHEINSLLQVKDGFCLIQYAGPPRNPLCAGSMRKTVEAVFACYL